MNKSDLISHLARQHPQLSVEDAEIAVNTILGAIAKGLAHGGRVEIRNFGRFVLNYRRARIGRNPKSGETVQVPAKYIPHFKTGVGLRQRVNNAGKARNEAP